VEKNIVNTPLGIGFLTTLYDASAQGIISEDIIRSIFNDVLPNFAKEFNILSIGPRPSPSYAPDEWSQHAEEISSHLSALLQHCLRWKLGWTVDEIITKIVEEAATAEEGFFMFLYLPFAKRLIADLKARGIEAQSSPFQKLLQLLLGTWIVEHVKAEPRNDWVRSSVLCTCIHCKQLNKFLRNDGEEDHGFQLPADSIHPFMLYKKQRPSRPDLTYKYIPSLNSVLVTKNKIDFATAHLDWNTRIEVAKEILLEFPHDTLAAFLGKLYEPIVSFSVDDITDLTLEIKSSTPPIFEGVKTNKWGKPIKTLAPKENTTLKPSISPASKSVTNTPTTQQSTPKISTIQKTPPGTQGSQKTDTEAWNKLLGAKTAARAAANLPYRGPPVASQQQPTNTPTKGRTGAFSVVSDLIDLSSTYGEEDA
jgi:hypothetical protein